MIGVYVVSSYKLVVLPFPLYILEVISELLGWWCCVFLRADFEVNRSSGLAASDTSRCFMGLQATETVSLLLISSAVESSGKVLLIYSA